MPDYEDPHIPPAADPHDYPPPDQLADDDDLLEGCTCNDPTHDHSHHEDVVADEDLESYLIPEGG